MKMQRSVPNGQQKTLHFHFYFYFKNKKYIDYEQAY